jgi:hypothetical protein
MHDPMSTPKARAFMRFHDANPHVYDAMVRYSRELKARGKNKIGVEIILGRVRWDFTVSTVGDSEYKISNNHKPFYARLIMHREADLAGLFELREAEADDWIAAFIQAEAE